jgi:hypothetical protein
MKRQYKGRALTHAVSEDDSTYSITQTFETSTGDAYGALTQHRTQRCNRL